MTNESWLIYLVLVVAATATPGLDVLFAVTTSATHGLGKALFAALGNVVGLLCLGIIAVTGLGALLDLSVVLFNIVKCLGAMYLIYMGIKLILRSNSNSSRIDMPSSSTKISSPKVFFQAMIVAISNPKAIVFLTALLPQFVDVEKALLPQFSQLIGGTLMFFSFMFLMGYAWLADRGKEWLRTPSSGNLFNRISGFLFVGFGLLLAASSKE